MSFHNVIKVSSAVAVALTMGLGAVDAEAKKLKVQASSKAGDWAHKFMTDNWGPKLGVMSGGAVEIDVLPTKAVVPHRETIDAVANGPLDATGTCQSDHAPSPSYCQKYLWVWGSAPAARRAMIAGFLCAGGLIWFMFALADGFA